MQRGDDPNNPYPGPDPGTPGHPVPQQPVPCATIPVPPGTTNLLDPAVNAKMVARGEAENEESK